MTIHGQGNMMHSAQEEMCHNHVIEAKPVTSPILKGIVSGVCVPITCSHIDAKIHHDLTVKKNPDVASFKERIRKDPLSPYKKGALPLNVANNAVKYGTLIGSLGAIELVYSDLLIQGSLTHKVASAATAGFLESITTSPTAYVSAQIKKGQALGKPVGIKKILAEIPKGKKIKTVYANFSLTSCRNIAFAVVYFPVIDPIAEKINLIPFFADRPVASSIVSSGIAGSAALILAQPFANAATIAKNVGNITNREVFKKMYLEGGLKRFHAAMFTSVPRMFVANSTVGAAVILVESVWSNLKQADRESFHKTNKLEKFIDSASGVERGDSDRSINLEKICGSSSGFE